ncbi:hypothetical protein BJV82DRAFT_620776 [Fennellomyces sp. T-0311]|nr:hypothetical protein BJV82DRAFT_620776 [Fennellomyces sp. T-0311]
MPRFTPCHACKKRRKRCLFENDSRTCVRCSHLHIDCILPQHISSWDDKDVLPSEIGPKTIVYWDYEVALLEEKIHHLELELDCQREKYRQMQNMEWSMTVENGRLKLHTPITSIEELILYGKASVRYLSPFKGVFDITTLRFDNTSAYTIINTFCRLYSQSISTCPNNRCITPSSPTLETEARAIADDLIRIYFKEINSKVPFLHEPTFLQHYHSLADPLSCPLTLAICVQCASTVYERFNHNTTKRKLLAELFYAKCKKILVDTFDDPKQAIWTVFTTTFLLFFVTFVLAQPSEARRLASISYLLCKNIEPTITKVDGILQKLVQRHSLYVQHWLSIFDMLIDGKEWRYFAQLSLLEPIPDESEMSKRYLDMINFYIRLWMNPCVEEIVTFSGNRTRYVSLEAVCKAVLIIMEWWECLPQYLRLCDDVYQVDSSTIDRCTEAVAILNLGFVHSALLRLHIPLITPLSVSDDAENGPEIQELVREKTVEMILRSCDILLTIIIHLMLTPEHDLPPSKSIY